MNNIERLIEELIIIRSATHSDSDYRNFTICIEKAKEYLVNDAPKSINDAAELAYPSTVNPDSGEDENWYNKKVFIEGAICGRKDIKCECDNEIKTGQTSVMCCNICGKPDEYFWSTGPLSFKEIFHGQLKKEVFKGQQNKIIELRKENELLMGVIDKLMNESNPSYNEAEREIIKDSVDRHMGKEFEAAYMRTKK